jgi:hypothetical protein
VPATSEAVVQVIVTRAAVCIHCTSRHIYTDCTRWRTQKTPAMPALNVPRLLKALRTLCTCLLKSSEKVYLLITIRWHHHPIHHTHRRSTLIRLSDIHTCRAIAMRCGHCSAAGFCYSSTSKLPLVIYGYTAQGHASCMQTPSSGSTAVCLYSAVSSRA